MDDQYSVIIRFDEQSFTDDFYKRFNRKHFSSLEVKLAQYDFIVRFD